MTNKLTNPSVSRQNILNNTLVVNEIQKAVGFKGILFESEYKLLKRQVADFFEVTERTIDNYPEKYEKELSKNCYEVLIGKRLMDFKLVTSKHFDNEIDFVIKTNTI